MTNARTRWVNVEARARPQPQSQCGACCRALPGLVRPEGLAGGLHPAGQALTRPRTEVNKCPPPTAHGARNVMLGL